jgi:hypothetical protein
LVLDFGVRVPAPEPYRRDRDHPASAPSSLTDARAAFGGTGRRAAKVRSTMGSLIKKRRKRMRKKKHKKMLKRTRFQRRAAGK